MEAFSKINLPVNKVIPDAKGQAAKLVQQSMAYRGQKIAIAKGEADRFKEVLAAYNMSRDVTARRLYLETMQDVLSGANKVITDGKNAGTVPLYLSSGYAEKTPCARRQVT